MNGTHIRIRNKYTRSTNSVLVQGGAPYIQLWYLVWQPNGKRDWTRSPTPSNEVISHMSKQNTFGNLTFCQYLNTWRSGVGPPIDARCRTPISSSKGFARKWFIRKLVLYELVSGMWMWGTLSLVAFEPDDFLRAMNSIETYCPYLSIVFIYPTIPSLAHI